MVLVIHRRPIVKDALDDLLRPIESRAHGSKSPLAKDVQALAAMVKRLVDERDSALVDAADARATDRSPSRAIYFYLDEDQRVSAGQLMQLARALERGGALQWAARVYEHASGRHWTEEAARGARRCHRLATWDTQETAA